MNAPLLWIGCGECDASFDCHEGRGRCIRLRPRYFVLRAPPGRCEDCKTVAAEGRFEVPWTGITGSNEGMTVCAACKPKYLLDVDYVELESPCPKHSRDGIAWCRKPRCAECPMNRDGDGSRLQATGSREEEKKEPEDFAYVPSGQTMAVLGWKPEPGEPGYQPTSTRDAYLKRWTHIETLIDRALAGSGLRARDLMAEAFRVSGLEVPPEVYSEAPAYRCGSCRDTGFWSTGIYCPVCCVYGPQQPRDASLTKPAARRLSKPSAPPEAATSRDAYRCPECNYDHEKEGPGASCLRARSDEDLIRECSRRWNDFADLFSLLYDVFELCVDLGEPLDTMIAQRAFGSAQRVAEKLSLRSRKFLADTVKKYPWLSVRRADSRQQTADSPERKP
jgi:hypothetical protein